MKLQITLMLMMMMIWREIKCENSSVGGLYIFGDSLLDSGNNNLLVTAAKANYPPYGMSFNNGLPTGRFTNGRTLADFIAEYIGLPYPPPYMTLLQPQKQKLKGINYASGSCGILPQTGAKYGKCLSMEEQIDLFEKTVKQELGLSEEESNDHLSTSLLVIATGNNDFNVYLDDTTNSYTPQSFTDLLILNISQQLQRLYKLGARKVVMFEIGAIGCMPTKTRNIQHNGTCVEEINQLAIIFNHKLKNMLQNLTSSLHGSSFILGQIYDLAYDAIINPSKYGLRETSKPCCVAWLNGTSGCIPLLGGLTCNDPEKHYFFDAYHPTQTLHKIIATLCFNGSSICIPNNIQNLLSTL